MAMERPCIRLANQVGEGEYSPVLQHIGRVGATQAGRDADRKKMRQVHRWVDTEDDEAGANRQTTSLAALALTLLLVVASFALVQQLRYKATVEDCLLSGRTNCGVSIPIQ